MVRLVEVLEIWLAVEPLVNPFPVNVTVELTTIDKALLVVVPNKLSLNKTVNEKVPPEVGVPLINPLLASRDNPAGRDPEDNDQE